MISVAAPHVSGLIPGGGAQLACEELAKHSMQGAEAVRERCQVVDWRKQNGKVGMSCRNKEGHWAALGSQLTPQ